MIVCHCNVVRAEEIRTVTDIIKRRRRGSRDETEDGV